MINEFTKEQEKQVEVYRNKWLAIGLSTDRINRKEGIKKFTIFNKVILDKKKIPIVIFMDSPITTWLATLLFYNYFYYKNGSQVRSQVWSQVRSQVWSQVWSQVESQVESQVWSQVESQVRSQVWSFVYPFLGGHFDSGYFGFYDFCNKVLKINFNCQKNWDLYLQTSDFGLIYPFDDFVVISEKPIEIKQRNFLLHNENGASIKYADGFEVYSLNGVRVSKDLVMTPAEQLDPQLVVKETNVEIRREIVRKIGIERVCQKLEAIILDKQGDYELLNLNLGENRIRPYLKMKNPSVEGVYHIEGVPPEIKTVEGALRWRNDTDEIPEVLS